MHGDFSRDSFDPAKHFSRVLLQQGRALLDADSNEQVAIFWHYLRTLAVDLIGPHGGPIDDAQRGFRITAVPQSGANNQLADLMIGAGRYYVDGLLCENDREAAYYGRPDREGKSAPRQPNAFYDAQRDPLPEGFPLLVYLAVWERLITAVEDPEIREVALGANGPDTAARAQIVWQVRATRTLPNGADISPDFNLDDIEKAWPQWLAAWQPSNRGLLRARAIIPETDEREVCAIPPESRYRGAENQLYRIEIHTGGPPGTATFKWSRDNGAQVFPIEDIDGRQVRVASLGRDIVSSLQPGDWVEIVDEEYTLRDLSAVDARPAPLVQIDAIEPLDRIVTLAEEPNTPTGRDSERRPFLRRWNHRAGDERRGGARLGPDHALVVVEASEGGQRWITLEDGIQISFAPVDQGASYRSGDYWLVPARTASGDVIWPGPPDAPEPRPPHGVEYHFAPLAFVRGPGQNDTDDARRTFRPLAARER